MAARAGPSADCRRGAEVPGQPCRLAWPASQLIGSLHAAVSVCPGRTRMLKSGNSDLGMEMVSFPLCLQPSPLEGLESERPFPTLNEALLLFGRVSVHWKHVVVGSVGVERARSAGDIFTHCLLRIQFCCRINFCYMFF